MSQANKFGKKHFWSLNYWLILVLVIILGAAAFWIFKPKASEQETVAITQVSKGNISKTVATTGQIVPNFEVEIKAKSSGKIILLPYDVSDIVKQGDLLAKLDPVDENREVSQSYATLVGLQNRTQQAQYNLQVGRQNLQTDIAKAQADLRAAQTKYTDAASKSKRLEQLVNQRYISEEEYETGVTTATQAKTDLDNAKIRLQELKTQQISVKAQKEDVNYAAAQAQAQRIALGAAQQRLSETQIYAPISGVVTSRAGQIGQIVASGISNVGGGTAIMTLADLSRVYVLADVDESDIGQIREGQIANITADAFPGERFTGRVTRISPKGVEESNVVTFEVKIEVISNNLHFLKPMMTTNVEVLIASKNNVLTIPVEAVITRNDHSFVRKVDSNGKPQKRLTPVTTGLNDGTQVEVIAGLKEGDKIVAGRNQLQSRWKNNREGGGGRRGQMMMMRGMRR